MPLLRTCTADEVGYAHVKVRDAGVDGCGLQACRKADLRLFVTYSQILCFLGLRLLSNGAGEWTERRGHEMATTHKIRDKWWILILYPIPNTYLQYTNRS